MRSTVLILTIIVICLAINSWLPMLPWYSPMILAFVAGIVAGRIGANPFITGFLGVGLYWALLLTIMQLRNDGILTGRISQLFSAEMGMNISPVILLIAAPLLGGLLGGLASLSGRLLTIPADPAKRMSRRRKKRSGSYKLKI